MNSGRNVALAVYQPNELIEPYRSIIRCLQPPEFIFHRQQLQRITSKPRQVRSWL
jgi:hypothetical protein